MEISVEMLLAIVAIWAIIIPVAILAITWKAADHREARAARAVERTLVSSRNPSPSSVISPCAVRAKQPRRTVIRRVCPERSRGVGRRPTSA